MNKFHQRLLLFDDENYFFPRITNRNTAFNLCKAQKFSTSFDVAQKYCFKIKCPSARYINSMLSSGYLCGFRSLWIRYDKYVWLARKSMFRWWFTCVKSTRLHFSVDVCIYFAPWFHQFISNVIIYLYLPLSMYNKMFCGMFYVRAYQ